MIRAWKYSLQSGHVKVVAIIRFIGDDNMLFFKVIHKFLLVEPRVSFADDPDTGSVPEVGHVG